MLPEFFSKKQAALSKAKETVEKALSASREHVAAKKAAFNSTQAMIRTAVADTKAMTSSVMDLLSRTRDEGILFIDYRGTVLHANQVAYKVLKCEDDRLIGKSIEALLTAKTRVRRNVQKCSEALFAKMQDAPLDLSTLAETCRTFSFTKISSIEVVLNEPIQVPYGDSTLQVRLSLLESAPAAVEDMTYLCKIIPA